MYFEASGEGLQETSVSLELDAVERKAYHSHALSEHIDEGLSIEGARVGEEEVGEGEVEEGDGGDDGFGGYERHDEGSIERVIKSKSLLGKGSISSRSRRQDVVESQG